MSTTLVGPLPTIRFWDGTRIAYEPPRDTRDKRYSACRDHRPACDCREAHQAEDISEYRATLIGHATWAFLKDGSWDFGRRCQCTGCQIARREHLRSLVAQEQDGVPIYRPDEWVAPR